MGHYLPYLSWAPFRKFCDRQVEHHAADGLLFANNNEIAAAIGAKVSSVRRAVRDGQIRFHTADLWACRLGVHPFVIWGDEWWQVSEEIDAHNERLRAARSDRNRLYYQKQKELVPA